jgi:hypothetical protein
MDGYELIKDKEVKTDNWQQVDRRTKKNTSDAYGHQQKVYAMRGFGVVIKSNFLISFSNVGQFRSRSVLAFRCASLLSPPKPRTA